MKTPRSSKRLATLMLGTALVSTPTAMLAQGGSSTTPTNNQQTNQNQVSVRVTRATDHLGMDVLSSDGHRIGEIADYYFDTGSTPHLRYVLINSGGFLGIGGDTRAVPAEALTRDGEGARLNITRDAYWDVAVMPMDRDRFLRNEANRNDLDERFSAKQAGKGVTGTLVSFTELRNANAYDTDGERIGRIVDTWVSLNKNRAPYVEISSPPDSPFQVTPRTRYAVPMRRIQSSQEGDIEGGFRFSLDEDEIRGSRAIRETEGVRILEGGERGDSVLSVRLAGT